MPLPLAVAGAIAGVKDYFLSWKVYVYIILILASSLFWYFKGRESVLNNAARVMERELDAQEKRSARAIKQAVKDAKTVQGAKENASDRKKEAESLDPRNDCPLDDDRLRLLRSAQEETER